MRKIAAIGLGVFGIVMAFVALVNLFLPIEDNLGKADYIVVISGGDTFGRTSHGVDLYKRGYAKKLVLSGAAKDPKSASNAKAMQAIAINEGVPLENIILEEGSRDTKENAKNTYKITGSGKRIILVTSSYHQRRALKEFERAYGDDATFINSPADDKNWKQSSWFITPYGWWIAITEPLKLLLVQVG